MSSLVLRTWIEVQRARLNHLKQDVREIPIGVISMPIRTALNAEPADSLAAMLLANGLTMDREGEEAGFPGTGKLIFRIIPPAANDCETQTEAEAAARRPAGPSPSRETQTVGPEDVGTLESVVGLEAKE